MPFYK
ncbi:hypothetical protein R3I93_018437 [Phoxinus phoxinus]